MKTFRIALFVLIAGLVVADEAPITWVYPASPTSIPVSIHREGQTNILLSWRGTNEAYIVRQLSGFAPELAGIGPLEGTYPWRTIAIVASNGSEYALSIPITNVQGFFTVKAMPVADMGETVRFWTYCPTYDGYLFTSYMRENGVEVPGHSASPSGMFAAFQSIYDSYEVPGVHLMRTRLASWNRQEQTWEYATSFSDWAVYVRPGHSNLVSNGRFEVGEDFNPHHWTLRQKGTNFSSHYDDYPTEGTSGRGAGVVMSSSDSGDELGWAFDHVPVTSGKTYIWRGTWLKEGESIVKAEFKNSEGELSYQTLASIPGQSFDYWDVEAYEFVIPPGIVSVSVAHSLTTRGILYVDDVSLREK